MEIERKFLLKNDEWRKLVSKTIQMKQGYICSDPEKTIRIRITDANAYITLKGKGTSLSHPEYEYEIPQKDAEEMFSLFCQKASLEKARHIVGYKSHIWEIDEFYGRHKGLVLAEVELKDENEVVELPDWVDREVTGNPRYYNSNLVKN